MGTKFISTPSLPSIPLAAGQSLSAALQDHCQLQKNCLSAAAVQALVFPLQSYYAPRDALQRYTLQLYNTLFKGLQGEVREYSLEGISR